MSANRQYLASIDSAHKTLKIYKVNNNPEHAFDIDITDMTQTFGVYLTADAVLVTDFAEGKLCKYALSVSSQPIWTCASLNAPAGIATDESGYIYVTSNESPKINIIPPEGNKTKQDLLYFGVNEAGTCSFYILL